jgi:hypothetical protein
VCDNQVARDEEGLVNLSGHGCASGKHKLGRGMLSLHCIDHSIEPINVVQRCRHKALVQTLGLVLNVFTTRNNTEVGCLVLGYFCCLFIFMQRDVNVTVYIDQVSAGVERPALHFVLPFFRRGGSCKNTALQHEINVPLVLKSYPARHKHPQVGAGGYTQTHQRDHNLKVEISKSHFFILYL